MGQTKTDQARVPQLASLPFYFEANRGQAGQAVQFLARGQSSQFFVSPTEAFLSLQSPVARDKTTLTPLPGHASRVTRHSSAASVSSCAVRMKFVGANPRARVTGEGELPGKINYFIGNDPARWHTGVSTFTRVRVEEIYAGVNLVYYGNEQRLEYDFIVAPQADPAAIAIHFDGPEKVRVDARGDLVLSLGQNEIRQPKPTIYQDIGGVRKEISGGYQLTDLRTVTFAIGDYDRALPLVIDPVLSYSTFFGGSDSDTAWSVAVDTNGFVYVAGETMSAQLATPGAFQTTNAGNNVFGDAFVAKFDNTASRLIYLTYLGGQADDFALALALDGSGNAYLTGYTDSPDFPMKSAIYTNISGSPFPGQGIFPLDGFVVKLDASGSNL
ncbi:MAG TPA: SBBP repeat-containing protein, partial [Verrucomicrobiae bacterium]|nr:SBBP repeat-containing protein [Verrucomicrobiae bacterium]